MLAGEHNRSPKSTARTGAAAPYRIAAALTLNHRPHSMSGIVLLTALLHPLPR
jgi:hypothetical protein